MIINKRFIRELEEARGEIFTNELKRYLLVEYAQEPFPCEYTEQDLYTNIEKDIRDYEAGKLDITVKSPFERRREEREYLQDLCIEKFCEIRELEEYIAELENILSKHGLESSRMAERRRIKF